VRNFVKLGSIKSKAYHRPFWMKSEKQIEMQDDRWQDSWKDKSKPIKEIRKELTIEGNCNCKRYCTSREGWQQEWGLQDNCWSLEINIQGQRRIYSLPKQQETVTAWNIDLKVKARKLVEGLVGNQMDQSRCCLEAWSCTSKLVTLFVILKIMETWKPILTICGASLQPRVPSSVIWICSSF
jgi:hypothetical protein